MNRENPEIPEALDALSDDELNAVIRRAQELLQEHDRERKAKAMADIAAILASSGLTPDDLAQKLKSHRVAAARKPVYRGGVRYQHPVDKTLIWTAKGQKPNWLRKLEEEGGRAVEMPAEPVNDNGATPKAANDDLPVKTPGDKTKAPVSAGSVNGGAR